MRKLQILNTASLAAMLIVNTLANLIPIGGNNTGEVSALYQNLFTPAPITFAVWGVIYALMCLFILAQWGIGVGDEKGMEYVTAIGPWFIISCLINIGWIFAWHFRLVELSVVLIALLLVSLIFIEKRLNAVKPNIRAKVMIHAGFDIYYGWITVATIANICAMLKSWNWNGFGISDNIWTVIVLIVGGIIGALIVKVDRKWISGLTIIWAYIGILIRHISHDYYAGKHPTVIAGAICGICIIIVGLMLNYFFCRGKISK